MLPQVSLRQSESSDGRGAGADLDFVGPEACTMPLRKIIQNYEYKFRYGSEYLLRMRKEITANYKSKKRIPQQLQNPEK
jgi:hypothetical protein